MWPLKWNIDEAKNADAIVLNLASLGDWPVVHWFALSARFSRVKLSRRVRRSLIVDAAGVTFDLAYSKVT